MLLHLFRNLIFSQRAGALVRRISFLSSASIFVSVLAFLLVLFVMKGMNRSIEDRVIALEPHLVGNPLKTMTPQQLEKDPLVQKLKAQPGVQLSLFEAQDVILRSLDGRFHGVNARGMDSEGLKTFLQELKNLQARQRDPSTAGSSVEPEKVVDFWDPSEELQEGEVLVGIDLARAMNLFEGDPVLVLAPESLLLPLGETPRTERMKVKKIISTNLADLDAQFFVYLRGKSMVSMQKSPGRKAGFEVRLLDGSKAESLKASLGKDTGFQLQTWGERNSDLFFALKLEKIMIGTFLALAGLVAGSSILTVMVLLLTQKRRDIALLRVLGVSGQGAVQLFSRIGLLLAIAGILPGAILGLGIGAWVEGHPLRLLPTTMYYDSEVPTQVDWILAGVTLLVAGGLSFLGAWIPSRTLIHLPPTDVLRGKN